MFNSRASTEHSGPRPNVQAATMELRPSRAFEQLHRAVFILFLICCVVSLVTQGLPLVSAEKRRWTEGAFVCLAAATTLVALARRLPMQNVMTVAFLIGTIAGSVLTLGPVSNIPFGPLVYSDRLGEKIFHALPWPIPLTWIVIILNARGAAELIIRAWRTNHYHGLWLIGLTALLATCFDFALEPFAVQVKGYWLWRTHDAAPVWCQAPWQNSLSWFLTAVLVQFFSTPWLINKRPLEQSADYHPLILWLLINFWVTVGNVRYQLWPATAIGLVSGGAATFFALRGVRQKN